MRERNLKWKWRVVLALIAGLVFLFVGFKGLQVFRTYARINTGDIDFKDINFNEPTKAALDIKLEQSRSQLTFLALLAGILWGLILVKKESPAISWNDTPEGVTFVLANLAVVVNGICHVLYMRTMCTLMALGGDRTQPDAKPSVPNFLDPQIDVFACAQQWTLVSVLGLVALLVFSGHKLKEA